MLKNFKEFLFIEDDIINVKEDYPIYNKFTVEDYLYGRCHIFAKVLNETLGFDIGLFIDDEPMHETYGLPCLEHAFCYLNEHFIVDAKGIRTKAEILDEYGSNAQCLVDIKNGKSILEDWTKNKLLISSTLKEQNAIKNYIELLIEHKLFSLPEKIKYPTKNNTM